MFSKYEPIWHVYLNDIFQFFLEIRVDKQVYGNMYNVILKLKTCV